MDIFTCPPEIYLELYDKLSSDDKQTCWLMGINIHMYDHRVVRGLVERARNDHLCNYDTQCACIACITKTPDKSMIYKANAIAAYFKHPPNKRQIELYAFRCIICINLKLWSTAADFYELANLHPTEFKDLDIGKRNAYEFIQNHWNAATYIQKVWRRHSSIKKKMMIAKICKSMGMSPSIAFALWSHQTIFV